jgi:hypothetical protein
MTEELVVNLVLFPNKDNDVKQAIVHPMQSGPSTSCKLVNPAILGKLYK